MAKPAPPSFIRWAARAVLSWQGAGELPTPVHHIHGDRDRVIPVRRVRADLVVRGAGHLLTLTHADEVHDFLARVP